MPWRQTPSWKKKAVVFTTVTTNAYQDQLNARFSKVCEIFKVSGIESLKYVREFHTPVCYCGDISTHRNVTLNETNCDWLFDMSGPWPKNAAIYFRPSAVSLKVWLRKTTLPAATWFFHPDTNQAQPCLASVSDQSWVAGWYGCWLYLLLTNVYKLVLGNNESWLIASKIKVFVYIICLCVLCIFIMYI